MNRVEGVFAALATPFDCAERLDRVALKHLVEWDITHGAQGFYVSGSTGESFMMTLDERKALLEAVVECVDGRCPIIVNVGMFATQHSLELARHAASVGADMISSVPPFYFPFSKTELKDYYRRLSQESGMPAIIYNVPAMAGVNFSTDDLYTLLSEPGIAGIKQTSMNLFQTEQLVRAFSEKSVINGHDEIFLSALAVGVRACIGSTVTFMPNMFVELKRRFDVGDHTGALELQGRINNIVRVLQNIGVFKGVKAALDILDINVGICRAPFEPLNPIELNQLETVLRENL